MLLGTTGQGWSSYVLDPKRTLGTATTELAFCASQMEFGVMADNKTKRGGPDRRRVAGNESYEVNYFARKHDITAQQARELLQKIGDNREKLNAAAAKLKRR